MSYESRIAAVSIERHFFFLLDASSSMIGERMQELNNAMRDVLPEIQRFCDGSGVTPIIHALAFRHDVQWLCSTAAPRGIVARDVCWTDIVPGGTTNTAAALIAIMDGLKPRNPEGHVLHPVIVLVSDGYSNDSTATATAMKQVIGTTRSLRITIGLPGHSDEELLPFASGKELYHSIASPAELPRTMCEAVLTALAQPDVSAIKANPV